MVEFVEDSIFLLDIYGRHIHPCYCNFSKETLILSCFCFRTILTKQISKDNTCCYLHNNSCLNQAIYTWRIIPMGASHCSHQTKGRISWCLSFLVLLAEGWQQYSLDRRYWLSCGFWKNRLNHKAYGELVYQQIATEHLLGIIQRILRTSNVVS